MSPTRRDFLKKVAATQAGLVLGGASSVVRGLEPAAAPVLQGPLTAKPSPNVIVVGAGAFGGWTSYYLATMGAKVTLVDAYGPGNSRATSGDETRGIRTSYGDKGIWAELWMTWANEAIDRWARFDAEWGREWRFASSSIPVISSFEPDRSLSRNETRSYGKSWGIPFETPKVSGRRP